MLHMVVGIIAEGVWERMAGPLGIQEGDGTFFKGYTMTLMVGQMLIMAALLAGIVFHAMATIVRGEDGLD
jgi:hypothetical protein